MPNTMTFFSRLTSLIPYVRFSQTPHTDKKLQEFHHKDGKQNTPNGVLTGRVSKPRQNKRLTKSRRKSKNKRSQIFKEHLDQEQMVNEDSLLPEDSASNIDVDDIVIDGDDEDLLQEGWSSSEICVKDKLAMRGEEPLMPELWQLDFPSFPDILFTRDDKAVFIRNLHSPVTEGESVLHALHEPYD